MNSSVNQAAPGCIERLIYAGLGLAHADAAPQAELAVAVADGLIAAVGTRAELQAAYPDAPIDGSADLLLTPAFVNAADRGYGLSPFSLGLADDLLEVWEPGLAGLPTLDPFTCAALAGAQLLRAGVSLTTHRHQVRNWRELGVEAGALLAGYAAAGIRVAWHAPYFDAREPVYAEREHFLSRLPPGLSAATAALAQAPPLALEAYLAICADLAAAASGLTAIQLGLEHALWCSNDLIRRMIDYARRRDMRVHIDGVGSRYQSLAAQQRWGMSVVQHLGGLQALGPWLTFHQPIWIGGEDSARLAAAGVAAVYSPGSALRQRCGIAPLAELTQRALRLGIGLDGHGLSDDQDYLGELRLAHTIANRPGADEPSVSARDVLHIGTHGGAMAVLGAATTLGRIAPGAPADLVLHDRAAICGLEQALNAERLAALLIRRGGRASVRHVMVAGRWVVRERRALHVDEAAMLAQLQTVAAVPLTPERTAAATHAQALAPYLRRFYAAWEEN